MSNWVNAHALACEPAHELAWIVASRVWARFFSSKHFMSSARLDSFATLGSATIICVSSSVSTNWKEQMKWPYHKRIRNVSWPNRIETYCPVSDTESVGQSE
jgi:hypothetical protein